jgi:hypothetical protein
MATRAAYGMRADARYVQARLNGRSLYTAAEVRWLERVEKVKAEDEQLDQRLAHDFPETYAGSVLVTKYPAAPYFLYRFTRDAQSHLKAIRRRSKSARVGTATVPLAQLDALEHTIRESLETSHEFDGFHVVYVDPDAATGTILIALVTARADHAAYFAAKWGPLVRTEVLAERYECFLADRRYG